MNTDDCCLIANGYESASWAHNNMISSLTSDKASEYKYFVSLSSSSNPGRIGGQVRWSVHATNDIKDLFEYIPDTSSHFYERNDEGIIVDLDKRKMAKEKFRSLKEDDQFALIEEMIIDRMLGKF